MLSREVAQNIVIRTMEILNYNINVMNEKGVIIGSGEQDRIGKTHEVAKQIQIKKDIIEIHKDDQETWEGVKPGINLPIYFQGEIVGTVGITGAPSEVRKYGQLVKMTAEMILEHSFLLQQIQYDERIKREFVNEWITDKDLSDGLFIEKAKTLGIDLYKSRGTAIIKLQKLTSRNYRKQLEKLEEALKPLLHKEDVISIINEHIVVVKVAESDDELTNIVKQWSVYFKNQDLIFSTGRVYEEYNHIYYSYVQALHTIDVNKKLGETERVTKYEDKAIEVLLHNLFKSDDAIGGFPTTNLLPNIKEDINLLDTLDKFIENNGQINKTASDLFIHRNTLHYRLHKIERLTGKNPRSLKDLFYLYCFYLLKYKLQ